MRTFLLNKLVTDQAFESMVTCGQSPIYRVLDEVEFAHALEDKLAEETAELNAPDADKEQESLQIEAVREQIDIINGARGGSMEQRAGVGAFAGRYFVKTVTLADDDPWQDYYLKRPERFPEQT